MINRVIIAALAVVLGVIGAGSVFAPGAFYESFGIDVAGAALSSELRGTGGSLVLIALAVGAGAIWQRWAFPAAIIGGLVMLGYALGRTVSVLADGVPGPSIVVAGVAELVLAAAAAFVVVRTRP